MLRIRKGQKCRNCNKITDFIPKDTEDEKWAKYYDRWISSKGVVLLENGNPAKFNISNGFPRFFSNYLNNSLSLIRSMAIAFKINNYQLLEDKNNLNVYEVAYKDLNKNNLTIDNLIIVHKNENEKRLHKSHFHNQRVKEAHEINELDFKNKYELKTLQQFPNYNFYSNGMIFKNGINQSGGISIDGYISGSFILNTGHNKKFKHHRLICLAFNPIEGKSLYNDYDDLQVNHIDGNKQNNSANNLEWCSQSQNQNHAINNLKNNRCKGVAAYNQENGELIQNFISIAQAARWLFEKNYGIFDLDENLNIEEKNKLINNYKKKCLSFESQIRNIRDGKTKTINKNNYIWKKIE
jgi:hypothetical protein